jgi:hypothetical protein
MRIILVVKKGEFRVTAYRDVSAVAKVVGVSRDTIDRRLGSDMIEVGEWFVMGCEYVQSSRGGTG